MRVLLAAVLVAGCATDPAAEDGSPTVDSRVVVLPDVTGMTVEADSITVPRDGNGSLAHLPRGTILVSTHGEGLLRKVEGISTSGGSITIATSLADLSEALVDGEVSTSVGGEGKADTYALPPLQYSITNKKLFENAVITATLTKGALSFAPELDLDFELDDHHVERFGMVVRGKVTGELDLDITAHSAAIGPEITLWESPPTIFYQQVGILPLVETVTTSIVLRLDATTRGQGRIHIDAGAIARFEGGLRYTADDGWDGIADASVTTNGGVSETELVFDQVGVRAWLAARTDVRLFSIAGPYVMVGPQAEASKSLTTSAYDASVGLRAGAGGGLKFLNFKLPASPTFDIFDTTVPVL